MSIPRTIESEIQKEPQKDRLSLKLLIFAVVGILGGLVTIWKINNSSQSDRIIEYRVEIKRLNYLIEYRDSICEDKQMKAAARELNHLTEDLERNRAGQERTIQDHKFRDSLLKELPKRPN